jgi:quercetin dioxygenase-like cupin family protein
MQQIRIEDIDSWMGPASVKRPLSQELDAEHVAINYYELEPGETFGFGYHRHPEQEEIFYLLDGVATFETEREDIEVQAGEAIRFEPGEWQLGRNDGEKRLRALALGAPAESSTEMKRHCDDCGGRERNRIERADDEDALVTVCEVCGAETGRFD